MSEKCLLLIAYKMLIKDANSIVFKRFNLIDRNKLDKMKRVEKEKVDEKMDKPIFITC